MTTFLIFCHPTFYVLPLLLQVFPEAECVAVAEPEVFALVFAVAEPSPEVVVLAAVPEVSEPSPEVVVFHASVAVYVVPVEVDSSGRPRFLVFSNIDYYASPSSSVEVVAQESVHSSTGARSNYGHCSILSNLDLHHNKNWVPCYNKPNPGRNNVSDTNALPMDATTNHSRKTDLRLYQEQRIHRAYQAALSLPEVRQIRRAAADQYQRLYLPLPSLE